MRSLYIAYTWRARWDRSGNACAPPLSHARCKHLCVATLCRTLLAYGKDVGSRVI